MKLLVPQTAVCTTSVAKSLSLVVKWWGGLRLGLRVSMANSTHSTNTPVFILVVRGIALSFTGLQAPVPICKLRSIDIPIQ